MSAINFVIIGYGGMGSYHAHTLMTEEKEKINLLGVYDVLDKRHQAASEKGLKIYESFEAVLADETVEAILIATPNDSHKELSIRGLQAGKHVICEKPVAMNVAELDEILAVAKETGNTFMVHQNRRWDPDFLVVRDLYQNKQIGEIFQIESRVQGANGIPGDWRHLPEHGGGMLLDWGVHLLDQILWLVKSPIKKVVVDFSYVLGDKVDDGFICYITFENEVKALIEVGTSNYTTLPRWYIKGYEGTGRIDDWDLSGKLIRATGAEDVSAPKPIQAGVGLTKTMAPPSEEAMEELTFPEPTAEYDSYYSNVHDVLRKNAEPIVKNSEVREVLALIDHLFELAEQ
ncbi:Gfo/Idh/MocA family protein [Enterococcus olivae]